MVVDPPGIHVDRRCPETEANPHGVGAEGLLSKVVEKRVYSQSEEKGYLVEFFGLAEEGSNGSMNPGDGFHQHELKEAHLPDDRIMMTL